MNKNASGGISRRSVIHGAATVAVSLAVGEFSMMTASDASAAEPRSSGSALATTNPVSIEDYVRSVPQSGDTTGTTTLLSGVKDEYRKAVAIFPLPLPSGYAFPAESSAVEPAGTSGTRFSVGTGAAEAYFFWQNATVASAYSAYLRGDHDTSSQLLDSAANGYATTVRKMYVKDADNTFITGSINPARKGDFSPLRAQGIDHFIHNASSGAIAAKAGDRF